VSFLSRVKQYFHDTARALLRLTIPIVLGCISFLVIIGYKVLDPTNIAWLGNGDPSLGYLGWVFYRHTKPQFPLGANPNYGLELSNSIIFSDSNPLLAFVFRPFASWLPEPFQYLGFWLLISFILQAVFAWRLLGLLTQDLLIKTFATGLFIFSPILIWRLYGHINLTSHFLILAAFYLVFNRRLQRRKLYWSLLLAGSGLIHGYILAMVSLLWISDLLTIVIKKKRSFKESGIEIGTVGFFTWLACWQAGYFILDGSVATPGDFGIFRMGLLSPFDPNKSYFLKDLPDASPYESYTYVGTGTVLLFLVLLPVLLRSKFLTRIKAPLSQIKHFPGTVLAFTAFTLFALSNKVGLRSFILFQYPLSPRVEHLANTFRASSRFFWPVVYGIVFLTLYLLIKNTSKQVALIALTLALTVQVLDTSITWRETRKNFDRHPATSWETVMTNPFWEEAAHKYKRIRWILPESLTPQWLPLGDYAAKYNLPTDAIYLSRIDEDVLKDSQKKAIDTLTTGGFDPDTLYIIDDNKAYLATANINSRSDLFTKIDGFNVVAPGWNTCSTCNARPKEYKISDLLPPIPKGTVITPKSNAEKPYLLNGWPKSEDWGTWSDGDSAEILLPINEKIETVEIRAKAFLYPDLSAQRIFISTDGSTDTEYLLPSNSENIFTVPLSNELQNKAIQQGFIVLKFHFPDAATPFEKHLGNDGRKLALGLLSITLK
jgi:hypothetical protein